MMTSALKLRAFHAVRAVADRVGLQVVPKTYYSPIPDLTTVAPEVWTRRSPLNGIHFDLDEQIAWIEQHLAAAMREFAPREDPGPPGEFSLANPSYGRVGADLLHGVVRALKPRRIVELGSGQSTLVMAGAPCVRPVPERGAAGPSGACRARAGEGSGHSAGGLRVAG